MVLYQYDSSTSVNSAYFNFLPMWISSLMRSVLNIFSRVNYKFLTWLNWSQTSMSLLESVEAQIFSYLKRSIVGYYVDIGPGWGLDWNRIWTIEMSPEKPTGVPLILVHGFAAGVGLWVVNLDSLSDNNRKLFAFDVLGFGRSSRPFLSQMHDVESVFVESIERWRISLGLKEKFILLGHSFGGYLCLAYALRYPENVAHLILADPWGIPSKEQALSNRSVNLYPLPLWVKMMGTILQSFNPLIGLRLAGPWGFDLIKLVRPDILRKFTPFFGKENSEIILNYIYHCNVQPNPSGEASFRALALPFGWAKYPMIHRVDNLSPDIGISFIFGSRSWIDREPAINIKYLLGDSRVSVNVIQGAGHHVYVDKALEFNNLVNSICLIIDQKIRQESENSIEA